MARISDVRSITEDAVKGITKSEKPTTKGSIVINDKVYKIVPLPWEEGIELWEDMMKVVLPSIGSGLDRLQHDEFSGSPTTFTEACINLSHNLDGHTLRVYSQAMFDGATVDGEPLDVNKEFTANYGAWRKLFVFALKENFESFFVEGWAGMLDKVMGLLGQAETEQE